MASEGGGRHAVVPASESPNTPVPAGEAGAEERVAAAIQSLHHPSPTGVTQARLGGTLAVIADLEPAARDSAATAWLLGRVTSSLLKCSFADEVDVVPVWHAVTVSTTALSVHLSADGPRLAPLLATHLDYTQRFYQAHGLAPAADDTSSEAAANALWRQELAFGQWIDARHPTSRVWLLARITAVEDKGIKVAFEGKSNSDEWFPLNSPRIAPKDSKAQLYKDLKQESEKWRLNLSSQDETDTLDSLGRWKRATIVGVRQISSRLGREVKVRFVGTAGGYDEWLPISSYRLAPLNSRATPPTEFGIGSAEDSAAVDAIVDDEDAAGDTVVYRGSTFGSRLMVDVVKAFHDIGGFDAVSARLQCMDDGRPSIDEIDMLLKALSRVAPMLGRHRAADLVPQLQKVMFGALLSLSEAQIRHVTKAAVLSMGTSMRCLLKRVLSPSKVADVMESFSLDLALKLFGCPFLRQRLFALKLVLDAVAAVTPVALASDLQRARVASWLVDNKFVEGIFDPQSSHPELMRRSTKVIKFLLTNQQFTPVHLDAVWEPVLANPENTVVITKVLEDLATSLRTPLLLHLLDKIATVPMAAVSEEMIALTKRISQMITTGTEVVSKALEVLWNAVMAGGRALSPGDAPRGVLPPHVVTLAQSRLVELLKAHNQRSERVPFLLRCVENLRTGACVPASLQIMWAVIDSFLTVTRPGVEFTKSRIVVHLNDTENLMDLVVADVQRYKAQASIAAAKLIAANPHATDADVNSMVVVGGGDHTAQVRVRLQFLTDVLGVTSLRLTSEQVDALWASLHDGALTAAEAGQLLTWLTQSVSGDRKGFYFDTDTADRLFAAHIANPAGDLPATTPAMFRCFKAFFTYVGEQNEWVELIGEHDYALRRPPSEVPCLQVVWGIVLQARDANVVEAALGFLIDVHRKISFILDDQRAEVTRAFVATCMDKLREARAAGRADSDATSLRCLQLLERLVNESDRAGSAGLRAHSQRLRGKLLTLHIDNQLPRKPTVPTKFDIKLYENATVWDLRQRIATEANFNIERVRLWIQGREVHSLSNPKTMVEMGLTSDQTVTVNLQPTTVERTVSILMDRNASEETVKLTPRAVSAFTDIYRRFACTNGALGMDDCARYFLTCGAAPKNVRPERMNAIFATYETNEEGSMTLNGFLRFYALAALDRMPSVWKDLKSHGFNSSLALVTPHGEGDGKDDAAQGHPRHILTSKQEYFDSLFEALSARSDVAECAWSLLMRMPTNPVVLEKLQSLDTVRKVSPDWDHLLDSRSPFRLLYSLQIIEMLLEPPAPREDDDGLAADGTAETKGDAAAGEAGTAVPGGEPDDAAAADSKADAGTDGGSGGASGTVAGAGAAGAGSAGSAAGGGGGGAGGAGGGAGEGGAGGGAAEASAPTPGVAANDAGAAVDTASTEEAKADTAPPGDEVPLDDDLAEWIQDFVLYGGFKHLYKVIMTSDFGPPAAASGSGEAPALARLRTMSAALLVKLVRLFLLAGMSWDSDAVGKLARQGSHSTQLAPATPTRPRTRSSGGAEAPAPPADGEAETKGGDTGPSSSVAPPPVPPRDGKPGRAAPGSPTASSEDGGDPEADTKPGTDADLRTIIAHMSSSVAELVRDQVDFARLHERLLQVLWQAASQEATGQEAACVEHAAALWVALCAHQPALFSEYVNAGRSGAGNSVSLVDLSRALLFCPTSAAVRREYSTAVHQLCVHVAATNPSPQQYFLRVLLGFLPASSTAAATDGAAGATRVLPEQCEQYFALLNRLLTDRSARAAADGVDFGELTAELLRLVQAHPITETRGSNDRDRTLAGILNTLSTLLTAEPQYCALAAGAGMVQELYNCLFALPTSARDLSRLAAPPKCKLGSTRAAAYKLLCTLCDGSVPNLRQTVDLLEPLQRASTKVAKWKYSIGRVTKSSTGYVGIKNLGCICYMNSMLQQFYMIPQLRYALLSVEDPVPDKNESLLYQLQTMFGFLSLSERQDFVPTGWCAALKDGAGRPVNVKVQQDAEEFLGTFIDKLGTALAGTPQAGLMQELFTYSVTGQLACQSCHAVSEREETNTHVAVEVKNFTKLQDSLANFVSWETIADYRCDGCQQSVEVKKRQVLHKLPRVLIIHLKRMVFNFDTMVEDKLHTRFEFDKTLNVAAYANSEVVDGPAGTNEAVEVPAGAGGAGAGAPAGDDAAGGEDGDGDGGDGDAAAAGSAVPPDFYEYNLSGIVCHTGETARAGHYYSFIRDRDTGAWNEFNDSVVKPFDYDAQVASRCFGGKVDAASQGWETVATNSKNERVASAYILVYERKLWDAPQVPPTDPAAASDTAMPAAATDADDSAAFGSGGAAGAGAEVAIDDGSAGDESKGSGGAATVSNGAGIDTNDGTAVSMQARGGTQTAGTSGSTAFVKELLELVRQGEKTRRQAVQRVVPPLIFQAVFEDNIRFFQDQLIYTPQHFKFFADLMRVSVPLVQPCLRYNAWPRTRSVSVASAAEGDAPDVESPVLFGARVIELGTKFLLDTLAHAADMDKEFEDIGASLGFMYSKHVPACKLLLQRLTRHPTYIDDLLLTCNNEVVRSTLASLIGVVLCTVTPLEDGFLTEREPIVQDEAGGAGTGAGRVGPEPVVGEPRAVAARFMDMFVGRLGEARKNWTRFSDYFSVLLEFAKISHKCRAFLIARGLITTLLDFYLGDASPARAEDAPKEGPLGNKVMQPKFGNLLDAAVMLTRSVKTLATPAEDGPVWPPTTLEHARAEPLPASESDLLILRAAPLYRAAVRSGMYVTQVCEILTHMIWEDAEFSRTACQWLVQGMEQASYDAVAAHWKCIRAVLSVDDSLRLRRVAMVLGDPLIGTVAAGAGLGLPPLRVPPGADVVPPEAERQRRQELAGVGKGVLTVMRSRRVTNERMVYNSLKELLALAQDVPAVVEYMARLPPEDPKNEDRYTDWMFSFLHKHTSDNATEFTPTPALLVRQQSGVDTFRSFEKFERRADALSGSANRRFDHRDVDLITAMQGSRLVSHTQAHQNSVVCDMRGFKHPESGRDAVAFLVTSRLANPIMFELTLKYPKTGLFVNFPYPDEKDLPIKTLIPGNSTRCVYWAMKIDDSNHTWGAYVFEWKYKLHEDLPKPHLRAHTDPAIDHALPDAGALEGPAGGDGGAPLEQRQGNPAAGRAPTPAVDTASTDGTIKQWSCSRCTFLNPYMTNTCDMCNMVRPA